nr:hypothetical protein [Candidatus Aminicenantes bacterium]NIM84766.1 hypothetical protein [Candidatus Aminicenantes bacterium]NIN17601.1 hypothetical protein [Candidatus Aminicenantes bacterium]NIN41479.1 hypothetical protein [Candidatus Aminicenantes bacterium]NIN84253.1 hypothetical protein [Candidatus Aminicenantes bacterium]
EDGSAVEKGRRLARLVREQRTLLILDGMEPLQYPPGEVHGFDGKLKDQGLKTLLKELAGGHPGLCVITSREPVTDLAHKKEYTVKEMELEHLSIEAGMQLLKGLEVTGSEKEMTKAVKEYKGHALALTLLGQYIKKAYDSDIRKRDKIPSLSGRDAHAQRVMQAYEIWLKESPELNVLRIMGLFDRPVEKGAVDALREVPSIPGVTDKFQKLSEDDWQFALDNLRTASLLAKKDLQKPDVLDCHPLVREHYAEQLERKNPGGWKAANLCLYRYYRALPEKELPDTLEEMEPLFAAIAHGCRAGLHQEVLDKVYYERVMRNDEESYITHKLGAYGAALAALSHFFEIPWSRPAAGLEEESKAALFNWAAFRLRGLGRLIEAIQPMQTGLDMRVKQKDWKNAAINAGNLCELMITLGRIREAVHYGELAVAYADRSGSDSQKESKRAKLAGALHQAGQTKEAERLFREAEEMQKERQPSFHFLYGIPGYLFSDLLLGQGKYMKVLERTEKIIFMGNGLIFPFNCLPGPSHSRPGLYDGGTKGEG